MLAITEKKMEIKVAKWGKPKKYLKNLHVVVVRDVILFVKFWFKLECCCCRDYRSADGRQQTA
jgi:hypothetical protein